MTMEDDSFLLCEVCKTQVPQGASNWAAHESGRKHQANIRRALDASPEMEDEMLSVMQDTYTLISMHATTPFHPSPIAVFLPPETLTAQARTPQKAITKLVREIAPRVLRLEVACLVYGISLTYMMPSGQAATASALLEIVSPATITLTNKLVNYAFSYRLTVAI